ncbi:MAG: methyltransferase [Campylobacterales bacterium]|nr:methyltransferase [Campylobacterales bacterium]
MQLYQKSDGYCYNSDSIFLYGFISRFNPKGRLLDVGAGCGIVGLLVARDFPKVSLEMIELQSDVAFLARKNAQVNGIDARVHEGDLLAYEDGGGFDYIVSNPPFYHIGAHRSQNDAIALARSSTSLALEPFVSKVAALLRPRGHFVFCYEPQQFSLICAALERAGLRVVDVQFVHSKAHRNATLVMIHARKHAKSLLKVWPPFFAFDADAFSSEARALYHQARTHSIKCLI